MKKFLASGIAIFLTLSNFVFAETLFKQLEDHIYEQIELLDDEIVVKQHSITHHDNQTMYQMGYLYGKRIVYYDILNYLDKASD